MVAIRLADDQCVWIDAHEVTQGEHLELVEELASTGDLNPFTDVPCQWKTDFTPGCGADDADEADPALPVTCVDWCDARAYCRFRGKTLCGTAETGESWWENACTSGGPQHEYPYGSSYEAQACNGRDNIGHGCHPSCALSPTGALVGCTTPSGIFDLSGNVSEWVDECSGYSNDGETCAIRGGNATQDASALQCTSRQSPPRSTRAAFIGFRCCWRPL